MPAVLTPKVPLFVNVIVDIQEMDLIVLVSKSFIHVFKVLYLFTNCLLFGFFIVFSRHFLG